ncbi:MAG: ribosomal protein L7ae, partial [Cenarchaeum symbiont of Oopsacas minuta]|nr:ribosomal protein L7ae [Cenarchaeum symbiont of Oopsacas minuta]
HNDRITAYNMVTLLEKTLKDSIKKGNCIFGQRQVAMTASKAKLIVVSESAESNFADKLKVPYKVFDGTSVALGKFCGVQFRVSTVSILSIPDATVRSIIGEGENNA